MTTKQLQWINRIIQLNFLQVEAEKGRYATAHAYDKDKIKL